MKQFETVYKAFLAECHEKNLSRQLINTTPLEGGRVEIDGNSYINMASNDYLGLAFHPHLQKESQSFLKIYGNGSGASRLVTGNVTPFTEIEGKIASIKGKEAALVLASGFQANGAVLQALLQKSVLKAPPTVVADRLNHASMHFGCAAAGIRQQRYTHGELKEAKKYLASSPEDRPRFLLTETVFSMDGDIAPIKGLADLSEKYGAMLVADDAHGFGILGKGGAGLSGPADLAIGTFSKACGSFGAYVAGSRVMIDYLIQRCGGLIYSTALPPANLGAINAALDLLPQMDAERARVKAHAARFRSAIVESGLNAGASSTQIVPVIVGDVGKALAMQEKLREEGFWVTAIRPPTVPKGTARLRFAFTAAHDEAEIERLINIMHNLSDE